ncbi:hypothetical protein ScPMuIL_009783 [Solemya velum]
MSFHLANQTDLVLHLRHHLLARHTNRSRSVQSNHYRDYKEIKGECKEVRCEEPPAGSQEEDSCEEIKTVTERRCCARHGQLCQEACTQKGLKEVEILRDVSEDKEFCHIYNCKRGEQLHLRREKMDKEQCCEKFGILCDVKLQVSDPTRGLVLITHLGSQRYVCGDEWDATDAKVLCRSMGFNGESRSYTEGMPMDGIWGRAMKCSGDEDDIGLCYDRGLAEEECQKSVAGVSCDYDECMLGTHGCPENTHCVDMFGGFKCVCNAGFGR